MDRKYINLENILHTVILMAHAIEWKSMFDVGILCTMGYYKCAYPKEILVAYLLTSTF